MNEDIKITFLGATREVTGSLHLIETNVLNILLDCGFFQGKRNESLIRNKNFSFSVENIDLLLLSHAHIDHSGNIPNLVKSGFRGKIISQFASLDLCKIMLSDSAKIQEEDAKFLNKKKSKKGEPLISPLYNLEDVEKSLNYFQGIKYGEVFSPKNEINITFYDAGHVLGSSIILLEINSKKILYCCDLGREKMPILKDPYFVKDVDFLIIESTYGDRLHSDISTSGEHLREIINTAVKNKGKIIIPAFALERTQELIYILYNLYKEGKIPKIPIFVDSPLAVNVTEVFKKHPECYDEETKEIFQKNENPFGFSMLQYIKDVEESKKLNDFKKSCIIISASGMCESGRILHHLKNNISESKNIILFVGFSAKDTLGRRIMDGEKEVKIFDEMYEVKAKVITLSEFSAHADRNDLLKYVEKLKDILKKVFVVHGEEEQALKLAEGIKELGIKEVYVPQLKESFII